MDKMLLSMSKAYNILGAHYEEKTSEQQSNVPEKVMYRKSSLRGQTKKKYPLARRISLPESSEITDRAGFRDSAKKVSEDAKGGRRDSKKGRRYSMPKNVRSKAIAATCECKGHSTSCKGHSAICTEHGSEKNVMNALRSFFVADLTSQGSDLTSHGSDPGRDSQIRMDEKESELVGVGSNEGPKSPPLPQRSPLLRQLKLEKSDSLPSICEVEDNKTPEPIGENPEKFLLDQKEDETEEEKDGKQIHQHLLQKQQLDENSTAKTIPENCAVPISPTKTETDTNENQPSKVHPNPPSSLNFLGIPPVSGRRRPKSPSLGRRLTRKILAASTHHHKIELTLQNAINDEDYDTVEKILLSKADSYDINYLHPPGVSILHQACTLGDFRTVKLLMEKGADVRLRTWSHLSPLMLATTCGHFDVAKLLIVSGADVDDIKDGHQGT